MGSLVRVGQDRELNSIYLEQICLLCSKPFVEADSFKRGGQLIVIFECQCDRDHAERIRAATERRDPSRGSASPCR